MANYVLESCIGSGSVGYERQVTMRPLDFGEFLRALGYGYGALDALLSRDDIAQGFKLVDGNVGRDGKKVTLPHYLAPYLYR